MALGVTDRAKYATKTLRLDVGEGLFLYTDGVTEAMDIDGNQFTEERLQASLQRDQSPTPKAAIQRALDEVKHFVAGAEQSDDITTLAIRYLQPNGDGSTTP